MAGKHRCVWIAAGLWGIWGRGMKKAARGGFLWDSPAWSERAGLGQGKRGGLVGAGFVRNKLSGLCQSTSGVALSE